MLCSSFSRRTLLLSLGSSSALWLAGCETNPVMKAISDAGDKLVSGVKSLGGRSPNPYREARNTPAMMQRAFDLYQASRSGNLVAVQLASWNQAIADDEAAEAEFRQALEQGKIKEIPDLLPYMERGFIPMLRQGYSTLVLQEQAKSGKRPQVQSRGAGRYELPPGTGIKVQYRGYCMDPGKPAPGKGELLDVYYIDQRVPERLRPVFKGLCQWLAETRDPSGQALTWVVLSAGEEGGHCAQMNQEQFDKLQKTYPNGGQIVRDYHNSNVVAKALLRKGLAKINPHLANIDTRNPRQFDRAVENELNELIQAGLRDQGDGQPGFTLLGPNVATRSVGSGVLSADTAIVNAGGNPVIVDLSELEQVPRRQRQSISGIAGKEGASALAMGHEKLSKQQEMEIKAALERTKARQASWNNVIKLAVTKGAELGSILTNWKADQWIRAGLADAGAWTKLVSTGATYLPMVGNALSLFEALTGRNWLTFDELSTGDRVAAIIGSVPGAQVFKSLAKIKGIEVTSESMKKMFSIAQASESRVGKILDTPQAGYFKDVSGWVAGNTSVVPNLQANMSGWMESKLAPPVQRWVDAK